MGAASIKHLENCFSQPSQSRGRKPIRASWPPVVTPEDERNFIENSVLGLSWREIK